MTGPIGELPPWSSGSSGSQSMLWLMGRRAADHGTANGPSSSLDLLVGLLSSDNSSCSYEARLSWGSLTAGADWGRAATAAGDARCHFSGHMDGTQCSCLP